MDPSSRRDFVKTLGICLVAPHMARPLAALAAAQSSAPASLDAAQWRCAEAICAEIIPTDQDPGATEAGCVNFIDKALATEDAKALPLYQAALAAIDGLCRKLHGADFADLPAPLRRQILTDMEKGTLAGWSLGFARPQDFFATIRFHTLLGFIADPRHGGNRDYAGWKLMGFPGPMHELGGASPEQMLGTQSVVPIWAATGTRLGHRSH